MRLLKIAVGLAVLLILIQISRVYYHSQQFVDFVQREAQHPRTKKRLAQAILTKAGQYSLLLNEKNITMSTVGQVVRVEVNYKMPLDLIVYSPELEFRLVGGGTLIERFE